MASAGSFAADREQLAAEGVAGTTSLGHGSFRISTTAGPDGAVENPRPKVLKTTARTRLQEIIARRFRYACALDVTLAVRLRPVHAMLALRDDS
jgi:hypothetical protein